MTTLHTVNLTRDTPVDLFDANTAVPPIPAGSGGYIQNISNREVELSDTDTFDSVLIIGGKTDYTPISTLSFDAGDTVFLKTSTRSATLTVAIG